MRFYAYFLAVLLMVSCGKQETPKKATSANPPTPAAPSTEAPKPNVNISGQVFVVTQGKENIKLALVEVGAIPEKDITQSIMSKHSTGLEQQKELKTKLESAKKSANAASASYARAKRKSEEAFRHVLDGGDYVDAVGEELKLEGPAESKNSNYKRIKANFDYFDSPNYYFESLPTSIAISKTDADGKFSLSLPAGKYAIAATSSRNVVNHTELYYWLVLVDTSSPNQSLMLSNDNLFETKCKECVQPQNL